MVVGLVIYFFYGSRHSRVATGEPAHAPSVREQQAGA
jgi:hypothetical protein